MTFKHVSVPVCSLDTIPHPRFRRYSDGNFAEVAPATVTPVSWSAVGPPMERAFRVLYSGLNPRLARAIGGHHFTFLGYFGAKMYHNVDGLCSILPAVPKFSAADISFMFLQGLALDDDPDASVEPRRALGLAASSIRRIVSLVERCDRAEEDVALAEAVTMGGESLTASSMVLLDRALDSAWRVHIETTCLGALVLTWTRALGQAQFGDSWPIVEAEFISPDAIIWDYVSLGDGLTSTAFLDYGYYEIGYGTGGQASTPFFDGPGSSRYSEHELDLYHEALTAGFPGPMRTAFRGLSSLASALTGRRERTKALAMRAMHCARALASRRGELIGEGWQMLSLRELANGSPVGDIPARLISYEKACVLEMPGALRAVDAGAEMSNVGSQSSAQSPKVELDFVVQGTGVAPGQVTAPKVSPGGDLPGGILVVKSADSNLLADLQIASGVVCEQGSFLSHVAIICRSLRIPAVVGCRGAVDQFADGSLLEVDGTLGLVREV
jgi:phosphohistidine swiveling domain-containing protein